MIINTLYILIYTMTPPIIQNINNAVLSGQKVMPMKDSTSDNTSTFSMNRMIFVRGDQGPVAPENKWIGGNRDSSQRTANRRAQSLANGSLNAQPLYKEQQKLAFTTKNDSNTQRNAIHRTRSGGARVPAKVTHKLTNQPVFYN